MYTDVLFIDWEDDYDDILTGLLAGPMSLSAINAELDRVEAVAASAFDADVYVTGTTAEAVQSLKAYWAVRHPEAQAQVDAH